MTMKLPVAIASGDAVGIFAPSSPGAALFPHRFSRGIQALEKCLACEVILPTHFEHSGDYTAGTALERAKCFLELVENPRVTAIFTTYGGYNSSDILSYLPKETLLRHPKILVGFSDTTALLLGYQAITGLVTYYGPAVLTQFGEYPEPFEYTLTSLRHILVDGKGGEIRNSSQWTNHFMDWGNPSSEQPRTTFQEQEQEIWAEGSGEGHLFGGNIATLNYLIGTPYFQPPPGPLVLFLEATDEEAKLPPFRRSLLHLKHAGVMEKATALLIGRTRDQTQVDELALQNLVREVTDGLHIPILGRLAFGHTDPIMTLPIGCWARVVAQSHHFIFEIIDRTVETPQQ